MKYTAKLLGDHNLDFPSSRYIRPIAVDETTLLNNLRADQSCSSECRMRRTNGEKMKRLLFFLVLYMATGCLTLDEAAILPALYESR
jgi:hypothetical protein